MSYITDDRRALETAGEMKKRLDAAFEDRANMIQPQAIERVAFVGNRKQRRAAAKVKR